jgi:hypothetical protein
MLTKKFWQHSRKILATLPKNVDKKMLATLLENVDKKNVGNTPEKC